MPSNNEALSQNLFDAKLNRNFIRAMAGLYLAALGTFNVVSIVEDWPVEGTLLTDGAALAAGLAFAPSLVESERQYKNVLNASGQQRPEEV